MPKKCPDRDPRVHFPKCTVPLPLLDITADKLIDPLDKFVKKSVRQLMLLESRIEQQPHKAHVRLMFVQRIKSDVVKYGEIVFLFDRLLKLFIFFPRKSVNAVLTALCYRGSLRKARL